MNDIAGLPLRDTIVVSPSFDFKQLDRYKDCKEYLIGMPVIVSDQVPPGQAYVVSSRPPPKHIRMYDLGIGHLPLRRDASIAEGGA